MLDKLESINERFNKISELLIQSDVISDMKKYIQLNKEYKELSPIIEAYKDYKNILKNIDSTKKILNTEKDEEFRNLAKQELIEFSRKKEILEEKIKILLIPSDPEDTKNAIVEIRAGTGGDEASLFVGDLLRMYSKFCEYKKWRTEITNATEGSVGGFKEIIIKVFGDGAYGQLKFESGVHRVQRIPQTETRGRIHTSAVSVVVFPEADEFDVEIRSEDIRKDTFCSSGPGGQSVNTTYSAVRLTHLPTGIVVSCQDERSQIKNYEKAMAELRSRIYNIEYQKRLDDVTKKRKTMISTGDRSAKIRTYNYPQNRITEHRINLTLYNLQEIIDGKIQEIIDALQVAENAEKLREGIK